MDETRLRDQYQALPYPPRNPDDERRRLVTGSPSHLAELDHYGFGGDLRGRPRPLRCLVAGGGTGDASIMLAQQLADVGIEAEILHVDLSAASCAVARARADRRELRSIDIRTGSFLDLAADGIPPVDYIDCCGVLHHLEDPIRALRHLAALLKPDGVMGLMVYGRFGRTGLYPLQDVLRAITRGGDAQEAIGLAKRLTKQLPESNWFRRNPFLTDHLQAGDAGLHDLLLSPRDRAFDVIEVNRLVTAAGLRLTAFIEPAAYDPASYLTDAKLLERVAGLPWIRRCAVAEGLGGALRKHVFYCVKATNPVRPPDPAEETAIPVLRDLDAADFAKGFRPGQALTARMNGTELRHALPPLAGALARRIDGRASVGTIVDSVARSAGKAPDRVVDEWRCLFAALNSVGKVYLRRG